MAGAAIAAGASLRKEMLVWEPVRMVSSPRCTIHDGEASIATLELSNPDLLHDFYDSVVLFYDVSHAGSLNNTQQLLAAPVRRLQDALEQLLLYYPSATGLLVHSQTDGRLEVQYPVRACACVSNGASRPAALATSLQKPYRWDRSNGHDLQPYGVQFHVAHADVSLSDLGDVSYPQPSLDLLFPSKPTQGFSSDGQPLPRFVLALQVTTFKCGSFALGQTSTHFYADGYSAATLLQNLCSIARGAGLANPPDFSQSRREIFKPREPPSPTICYSFLGTRKRVIAGQAPVVAKHLHYGTTTRFAFSMGALEALRSLASKLSQPKKCSRIQALMALLWMAYAKVKRKVHGLPGSDEMPLRFSINLRTRGIPNITPRYVGNALFLCTVRATLEELCGSPLANVVDKIRSTVGSLELAESLQSVIDDIELTLGNGLIPFIAGGSLGMASLVGLPFYDADCGWGPPIYVGLPSQQLSHRCLILEHPAARAWNVLSAFASVEECTCFEESIADHICP